MYYVGSPGYRIKMARSYKQAEAAAQRVAERAMDAVKGSGSSGNFTYSKGGQMRLKRCADCGVFTSKSDVLAVGKTVSHIRRSFPRPIRMDATGDY
ncbi:MAG: hypothetical protein QMC89_03815 [Candidatus Hodarchaeaceae archaeon]|nr:hypothetical protein [Candidatus Hodarchaeaceae archaeon]